MRRGDFEEYEVADVIPDETSGTFSLLPKTLVSEQLDIAEGSRVGVTLRILTE